MVNDTTAKIRTLQAEVGTMLQLNRNELYDGIKVPMGLSACICCFSICSIKTPVQGDERVVKASGWSGFAHLSFFPVTQVTCSLIC